MEEKLKRCEEVRNELIIKNNRFKAMIERETVILVEMENVYTRDLEKMLKEIKWTIKANAFMFVVALLGFIAGITYSIQRKEFGYGLFNLFFMVTGAYAVKINLMRKKSIDKSIEILREDKEKRTELVKEL